MGARTYQEFLESKQNYTTPRGVDHRNLSKHLFPFQRAVVEWALKRGRAAIFADTGLGKTIMQLEWAKRVSRESKSPVLIVAPLCVSKQSVSEAGAFGIPARYVRSQTEVIPGDTILLTNYEMFGSFDIGKYSGVVLDESSILKHQDSKTRLKIIDASKAVPYRLCCSATPAPNDHMELGSQSEFLGILKSQEMLARFFTHDGANTSKWRLKGHGKVKFWEWMASWSVCFRTPKDIGFPQEGYDLPRLSFHHSIVKSNYTLEGELFPRMAETLSERRSAQRQSISDRVNECAGIVNRTPGQWLVWCHLNDESKELSRAINGAVEVKGSDSLRHKESSIQEFTDQKVRVLVTKPSIAGFGMNWQQCHNMAFVGLNDSFEQFYQAVRRCWRYGQKNQVSVHIISSDLEGRVLQNIQRKERDSKVMVNQMVRHMREFTKIELNGDNLSRDTYAKKTYEDAEWTLHVGDCVDVIKEIPNNSIDYSIFSPPFASLYTYTSSDRDMGNSANDKEFYDHFSYLVDDLKRVTKPGRNLSFHCMNLPTSKMRDGRIGIKDFRGELIRLFVSKGWLYHSEVCIWKNPVTAMQRTKALGLLWKQLKKDSAMSRMGIPDYVVTMRKPGVNQNPVRHTPEEFPVTLWQKWASPVWNDINQSRTLNRNEARENEDERHICPLQLDVIERCVTLWSNKGDVVLSPFAGIGSEGVVSLELGRRFVGIELKAKYADVALSNLRSVRGQQMNLLAGK